MQGAFTGPGMLQMLSPIYAAMFTRAAAVALLAGVATESEVDETLRGMPHNVTTEMDLALWRLASAAREHRDLLMHTPPAELAARYRAGDLPEIGLDEFLRRYGHRGAAEIDVGVPRWAEDPTPVFAAIAGYLRVTDPEQAPDRRFARAAEDDVAKIDELVARARRTRPVRARCAGFLLRRSRAIAGLRELPKFAWLYAFAEMREPAPRRRHRAARARPAGPRRRHHVPRPPRGPRRGGGRRRPAGRWSLPAEPSTSAKLQAPERPRAAALRRHHPGNADITGAPSPTGRWLGMAAAPGPRPAGPG